LLAAWPFASSPLSALGVREGLERDGERERGRRGKGRGARGRRARRGVSEKEWESERER
jgi:hypothetical protein